MKPIKISKPRGVKKPTHLLGGWGIVAEVTTRKPTPFML